ncbi:MAG: exopolyphosphatase [Bacteroidota bacterium]|jgi:exopolyphosphatase/guanosine-5'-triphosphate,3'-diphosphate pyrophosphatase
MKAIIDLGTNTFHLLIANLKGSEIEIIEKIQIPVKIGEGGINNQQISEAAFKRGIQALEVFSEVLNKYKITQIKAFGTSAIRDAENGSIFIQRAADLGIPIEAISGNEEAMLIYEGVKHSFALPEQAVLIMDIGGGSVEFIIALKDYILWKESFNLGAARLIERFHSNDPITSDEVIQLSAFIEESLAPLWQALHQYPAEILIGSAGSFETLVEVLEKDLGEKCPSVSMYAKCVSIEQLKQFCDLMKRHNTRERLLLKGMASFRVDMIVVAAILMEVVTNKASIGKVISSAYALKEGMLFSLR